MLQYVTAIGMIVLTVVAYALMGKLYRKVPWPALIPALTTTAVIVILLMSFDISYESYMVGGKWINYFLGPAVVSLAYPLYKKSEIIRANWIPVFGGAAAGLFMGMVSGILLAKAFGFSVSIIYSLLPKSITTPVAMEIAGKLGGNASLASVFVMVAGFTGVVLGPVLIKQLRIDSPLGRGIGFGAASHALGTAKAFEYGEEAVSMSTVAMTVNAIAGSILGPIVAWLLL